MPFPQPGWSEQPLSTRSLSTTSLPHTGKPPTPLPAIPDAQLPASIAHSALYRLPGELRTYIFALALTTPLGVAYPSPTLARGLSPALLRTCRAVHAECLPLLYSARPIFSHPSDANIWAQVLACRDGVGWTSSLVLRVKWADTRLWTGYFNSLLPERSLVRDFPGLKTVVLRFRGLRYDHRHNPQVNVRSWMRDQRLAEVVIAVRKCVEDVKVELCIRMPTGWQARHWEQAAEVVVFEASEELVVEGGYVRFQGVWMKLETEGT